jgi:predicted nucleic acid-binding protein
MDLLIDTNVPIDHLRKRQQATAYLSQTRRQSRLWLSAITVAELYVGQKTRQPAEAAKVKKLLQHFRIAYLDGSTAIRGGELARDYGVALPDALIAATALQKGLSLATCNIKHFAPFPHLKVLLPY